VTDQLQKAAGLPSSAAQSVYDIVFAQLIASEQVLIVFGLVIFAGAILAGPAKWAVAMREGLSGGLSGVASHLELGRFGEWVSARKRGLRVAGIIGAVLILLLLPAPRTIGQIVWLAIGVVVWYVVVEVLGAGGASAPGGTPMAGELEAPLEADESADEGATEPLAEDDPASAEPAEGA